MLRTIAFRLSQFPAQPPVGTPQKVYRDNVAAPPKSLPLEGKARRQPTDEVSSKLNNRRKKTVQTMICTVFFNSFGFLHLFIQSYGWQLSLTGKARGADEILH